MIVIPCPNCGPRNQSEFRYVGEPRPRPTADADRDTWRRYLYDRDNKLGWVTENWYHTSGCRRFFKIDRHTFTNETRPVGTAPAQSNGGNA